MKELSIEEKAKRYDEAIEIAKEINNEQCAQPFNVMTKVFPELREDSEDERIRKAIINVFATHKDYEIFFGASVKDILAWLEKQGEPTLDIEVPFGSKDSELQEASYHNIPEGFHAEIDGNRVVIKRVEQKPDTDFSDLRTWKYIVDAIWTEKEGIGQYLDSPFTEEVAKKLQKRFGNIEPHIAHKKVVEDFRKYMEE